ncbi:hypothetical protein TTHERM_01142690 (macronuclear) [Tetrahymena thermophila SB210]|uniref:Uncharacterized protein n=1 Tax=Tetrahymena thermophila (strain SB210) TaxID=312017 RepID=Q22AX9_TETTS|nr:hypothetical protein TTHERM_01142690 [Tetrahymena thermophila SB210]EAR82435.3 hypothetical protein TTHERM_01142690 [Tetrahymena thermophila SB210]|eukprot:XP_001030098.3 hypothetical protein TTHERM_01142690 [Tetrahymena thermophila SB210]
MATQVVTIKELKILESNLEKDLDQFLKEFSSFVDDIIKKEDKNVQEFYEKNTEFQKSLQPIQDKNIEYQKQTQQLLGLNEELKESFNLLQNQENNILMNELHVNLCQEESALQQKIEKENNQIDILKKSNLKGFQMIFYHFINNTFLGINDQTKRVEEFVQQLKNFAEPYNKYFGLEIKNPEASTLQIIITSDKIVNELIIQFNQNEILSKLNQIDLSLNNFNFLVKKNSFGRTVDEYIERYLVCRDISGLVQQLWKLSSKNQMEVIN